MKFGQFIKMENIKKKIDEDEKANKKTKRIKEGSDEYNEQTKLLNAVMRFTNTFISSSCQVEKTECILVITNLLTNHLYDFMNNGTDREDQQDGEMLFEKK